MDYVARFEAKLSWTKTSLAFASNAPKTICLKNTFRVRNYLRNHPSPIFKAKRTMWRVWGLIVPDDNIARFHLKCLRNLFSEKHVFGLNFFTIPSPHLFSGPNELFEKEEFQKSPLPSPQYESTSLSLLKINKLVKLCEIRSALINTLTTLSIN